MTAHGLAGGSAGRLDAAIAERAYEAVVLRLALGLLQALTEARTGAGETRDELLALLADDIARGLGDGSEAGR